MKLSELKIDNVNGLGVTPNNMEIDYFGVKVKMTPSMYLKLAAPLEHEKSVDFFREKVKNNEGISSPTLYITVPDNWKKEEFSEDRIYGRAFLAARSSKQLVCIRCANAHLKAVVMLQEQDVNAMLFQ